MIFCSFDKIDMNWYYYLFYVYGCWLIFFFCQDFFEEKKYRFVEFYWKLNQVCDEEWYYYVFNVEFLSVIFYVDGMFYEFFFVIEDYLFYLFKIEIQFVVGVCW